MKTKHTQGEWVVSDQDENGLFITREDGHGAIARIYNNNALVNEEYALANAKLIAAAPDLLEALEYLLNCSTKDRFKCELQDATPKAKAAIKKAKGE